MAIEVEGLTMTFGDFNAVDNLSFTMRKNEAVGVIGPNGAGKTTFVSLLSGQFPPTSGTVKLFGKDATRVTTQSRVADGVMRSFQLVQVFDNLTVQENIALAYYKKREGRKALTTSFFKRLTGKVYDTKVDEVRELFGFKDATNTVVGTMSLGSKKLLEIAMIYVTDPELMILDEPFAGLSDQEIDDVLEVLAACVHKKTLLIVEHKLSKLCSVVDKLAVMHEGRLIAYGPCEETLNSPEVRRSYWKITEEDPAEGGEACSCGYV
jgi:branched-chain amino acid transport system ATP-binding protein